MQGKKRNGVIFLPQGNVSSPGKKALTSTPVVLFGPAQGTRGVLDIDLLAGRPWLTCTKLTLAEFSLSHFASFHGLNEM